MATEAELIAKYTEAFKNFSEDENEWKRNNVEDVSNSYPQKCKQLIEYHFSDAAVTATDSAAALTGTQIGILQLGIGKLIGESSPIDQLGISLYFAGYQELYPTDDFSDVTGTVGDSPTLREMQDAAFKSRCGSGVLTIEIELDKRWNEYKKNKILADSDFEGDVAEARALGQDAVLCAQNLVSAKDKLSTAIEQFYSQAGPSLFLNSVILPRHGFAGTTGDAGFNYLNSIRESGATGPGYITIQTVSFGNSVTTALPVITANDDVVTHLKFPEKPPGPLPAGDSLSAYPLLYFSILFDIVKGAEALHSSAFWPTRQEVANFYQGSEDSSIPVLRKVGGSSALITKFNSDNQQVGNVEIDYDLLSANEVSVNQGSTELTEEQNQMIRQAREEGSLQHFLKSYTPNMLGSSTSTQIGATPKDTAQLAEAYSRKQSIIGLLETYLNGVLPTIDRNNFPAEARQFIETWINTIYGLLKQVLHDVECVKDNAAAFEKEKQKVTDALVKAAKNAGEGQGFWGHFWPGGVYASPTLAQDLNQAAQNLNNLQIEDTAFGSIEEKKLFKEQCFLLAFVARFADYKKNTLDSDLDNNPINKRLPYTTLANDTQTDFAKNGDFNASLQIDGLPYGFINRLTQTPSYKSLIDIPHSVLSHLQPRIRLFKVIYDSAGNETEVEIEFNSAFFKDELERTFKSKKSRGSGVGLSNFEFTYDGSNPFAAKKSIKAKMSLFAASFSELFDLRTGNSTRIDDNGDLAIAGQHKYRYVDLALKTSNNPNQIIDNKNWARILEENGQLSKLNFRLKAVVGWSLPSGKISGMTTAEKVQLNNALGDSFVTLNLTPTVHNFDFNDTGAVQFDINYLAYVDDFFDQRAFNVFANPNGDTSWSREIRRLKYMNARKKCSTADSITQINDSYKSLVQQEMKTHLSSLIKALMDNDKVYFIDFPYEQVQNFVAAGPYQDYKDYVKLLNEDFIKSNSDNNAALTQLIETAVSTPQTTQQSTPGGSNPRNTIATQLVTSSPESNMVSFFYLSDLVDITLENIQKELDSLAGQYANVQNAITHTQRSSAQDAIDPDDFERRKADLLKFDKNFKRFRLLLGPVELHHVKKTDGKNSEFVNFGDIPISVKYFIEWVAGQVLSKDEIFYPLATFLNQLLNNLVTNFLNNNRCFYFDIKQKVRVNQAVVSSYSPPNGDNTDTLTALIKEKSSPNHPTRLHLEDPIAKQNRPILNVSGRTGEQGITYAPLSHETNYLVFYAGRVASPSPKVNRREDEEAGIFHYMLGRDRGLIKNIKLQKTQTKGLAEARFEMDGYDGLQQLRVVYDVNIDTFANVNTFPGTYIYIPPGGFDPSWAKYGFSAIDMTSLGIGGYYMIIKSTHRFGPGQADSQIYAKWVNSLETDYPEVDASSADPSDTTSDSSCEGAADRLSRAQKP